MAIDNDSMAVYSSILLEELYNVGRLISLTRDRSNEVSSGGDELFVDGVSKAGTVTDVAADGSTTLVYDSVDDKRYKLPLSERKMVGTEVPDAIAGTERAYNAISELARQDAINLRGVIENHILSALGGTGGLVTKTPETFVEGTNLITMVFDKTDGSTGTKINTPAARKKIVEEHLMDAISSVISLGWDMGRTVLVVNRFMDVVLRRWAIDEQQFGTGMVQDNVLNGYFNVIWGVPIVVSPEIPIADLATAANDVMPMYLMMANDTVHFAKQYEYMEAFRESDFAGWRIRGMLRYGAKVLENNRRFKLALNLEA